MMKAKSRLSCRLQRTPIGARRLQQDIRTNDIGCDESFGAINRPIHMRLGCQMHDRIRLMLLKHTLDLGTVSNIHFLEGITWTRLDFSQRQEVSSISELVDIHYTVRRLPYEIANQSGPDKSGPTSEK